MKERESNIEVFRCFAMFCIVLLHCCQMDPNHSLFSKGIKGLTYFGVDAFILISGWFGVSFSWKKTVKLIGYGVFASGVLFLCSPWATGRWLYHFSLGWFGNAYLALLCLSPIINAGIETLKKQSAFVSAWFAYAMVMVVDWLPLGASFDFQVKGWDGLSFNVLMFVYVTGRLLSNLSWPRKVNFAFSLVIVVCLAFINLGWGYLAGFAAPDSVQRLMFVGSRDNNSPLTIAMAVALFLMFRSIRFPQWICKGCLFIAPSLFSVYLLHCGVNRAVSGSLMLRYAFKVGVGAVGAACGVFVVCLIVDIVRRLFFVFTYRWLIKPADVKQ